MGRMHPVECPHGKVMDPGSFDIAIEECAECDAERERVKLERIHRICPYLRDLRPCKKCPEWELNEQYGKTQRACYGMAEEAYNIAVYGNERGREPPPSGDA